MQSRGVILSLLVLIALLGCVTQPPAASAPQAPTQGPGLISAPAGLSGYNNFEYGVAMNYPTGWTKDESSPALIVAFSPPGAASDGFTENVGLTMQDLRERPMTLEDYTALTLQELPTVLQDFSLLDSKPAMLGSLPAHQLVYTITLQDGTPVKALQVYATRKDIIYSLVYINKPAEFAAAEASAQAIINSFQVTKDV